MIERVLPPLRPPGSADELQVIRQRGSDDSSGRLSMWPRAARRPRSDGPSEPWSGWGDDDLAEGAALPDVGQRFRYLIERVGAVDVDAHVTGEAQIGQRLEVGRTRLHGQHPEVAARDHAHRRTDRE